MIDLLRRLLCLPEEGSTVARDLDVLHIFVISITMIGATAVALAALAFVWKHGKVERTGPPVPTPRIVAPAWLEGGLITLLLFLFFLWWFVGANQFVRMTTAPADATDIYVVGKQWVWEFSYPGGQSSIGRFYVPAHRPVRLLITSRDVIHSFYVPAFRLKMDAVPGRTTMLWFEAPTAGTFDIYCAEMCGAGHSKMRGEVTVLTPEEEEAWLRGQGTGRAKPDLATTGMAVAVAKGCLQCHSTDGSPRTGPSWLGLFGREETLRDGSRVLVDGAYVTESMMDPNAKVVAGYLPVMPSYRGRIEPGEVAAIVELLKSIGREAPPLSVLERGPRDGR